MPVDLCCLGGISAPPAEAGAVQADAQSAMAVRQVADMELSVVLTDDQTIQQLNRDYRGMDKPTDVLSFAQQEADGPASGVLVSCSLALI